MANDALKLAEVSSWSVEREREAKKWFNKMSIACVYPITKKFVLC